MIATRTVTLTEFVPLIFSPPDNSIALQKTFPCLGAPYNLQQYSDISTTPKLSNYSLYFFSLLRSSNITGPGLEKNS